VNFDRVVRPRGLREFRLAFLLALLVYACCMLSACKSQTASNAPQPTPTVPKAQPLSTPAQSSPKQDAPATELHIIGTKIAKAVLAKDISSLLTYDRVDLKQKDEIALKSGQGEIYCYVFGTDSDPGCSSPPGGESVYERLSSAHDLAIKTLVTVSPANGRTYGALIFYDRSKISEKSLESDEFVCKAKELVSWQFELSDGQWHATTPFFDYGTEGLCSS
jgi:hypothetical protein